MNGSQLGAKFKHRVVGSVKLDCLVEALRLT